MNKRKWLLVVVLTACFILVFQAAYADETDGDGDYPWNSHASPYDFPFGNMIDTHQQSRKKDDGTLRGFLYVHYTGELTGEGYAIARKANCLVESCEVGWLLKGVPITATLLQKGPRVWLVDLADLPDQAGYTHFQWVGQPGSPHGLVVGQEYPGILLRRIAPTPFFWLGGSGGGSGGGGGCGGHEAESSDGHDSGCDDGHDDGCDGGSGSSGGHGSSGHGGRLVTEGIDHHSNIVTDPADIGHGGGGGGCDDGCSGDDGGCTHG